MPVLELSPGNSLAYEHQPPSSSDGLTFVCFNALTGDKVMWETGIGPDLAAAGHGLLTYNLRGQAGSDFSVAAFDESLIIEDALALMKQVAPRSPVYVGLSIGGLFAAKLHLHHAPADGLVLINTLRRDGPRLKWINDALVRAAETGGLELLRDLYAPLLFNEDWQKENRPNFLRPGGYTPLAGDDGAYLLLRSGGSADWDLPLEDIRIPVLNLTGLQDHVFYDAADVDELFGRLPNADKIDMPGAGHMIPAENPRELAGALLRFAERCRETE